MGKAGKARNGTDRNGGVGQARRGLARTSKAWFGRQVEAGHGAYWSVEAGQAWHGVARRGEVRCGMERQAWLGESG